MIALTVLGGVGYLLQKPSDLQKAQQKRLDHQATLQSLKPLNARTGQPMTAASSGIGDLEASDLVPDVPLRGGYGDQYSPPYLNADWQIGSALTKPDRGQRQATLQEPPRPGAFLGLNDMSLGDDMRARTMMEPGQYQRDFNNFNGENGWQQGMTLVGRPNPQQAQIDARRVPITSLSKPSLGSIAIGPDERTPNPTSTLGVSFNVAARGYNQIVRLPEKATAFENQMGAATPGGTGNANMRPEILNSNPYLYTGVPKQNCYVDLGWTPAGDMGANGFWGDTIRGTEGEMVRKRDSIVGRVGGKQAVLGCGIAPEAVMRAPLTKEVEARVPGGTYVDNPNQCDRIDMSMEGQHMSQVPLGKDIEHRETAAQNLPSYTGQGTLPFTQGQKQAQELLIENNVGGVAGLELHAGAELQNPVWIAPVYVNRF